MLCNKKPLASNPPVAGRYETCHSFRAKRSSSDRCEVLRHHGLGTRSATFLFAVHRQSTRLDEGVVYGPLRHAPQEVMPRRPLGPGVHHAVIGAGLGAGMGAPS